MGKKCRKWIIWCALLILGITMPLSATTAQAAQTEQGSWLNDTWSSLLGYNYSTTSSPSPTAGMNTTQETPYDSIVSVMETDTISIGKAAMIKSIHYLEQLPINRAAY